MGWNNAVITLAGAALMAELVNGGKLSITRAAISENIVPAASLITQTAIVSPLSVPVAIAGKKTVENILSVRIQVHNTGVEGSRKMRQLGIFAKTETVKETLFAIMQNEQGDEIPPESEYPQFLLEMNVGFAVSNAEEIIVKVDPTSTFVTQETLSIELDDIRVALNLKADKSEIPTSLPSNGGNADTVGGVAVETTAALGLHQLASGTAAATSENCPPGAWYGQYS
ncbi:MAG: hypothetical protein K2J80_08225 [Oscillospiraceae bacterium]|nr:hypothetical protein [Oscillospiraceae bacterium]